MQKGHLIVKYYRRFLLEGGAVTHCNGAVGIPKPITATRSQEQFAAFDRQFRDTFESGFKLHCIIVTLH